jgi:nucleoside-diphosphate-sugar epimerase
MPDSIDFYRKPVLVLGASGFIGSRVVTALADHPAYRPVAASRRPTGSALAFDATDPVGMEAALRDVDFVINCIAGNQRAMVRATEVLCDAARSNPPRRIVHLSSMAVYGAATGLVQEDHVPVPPVSGYGLAKIECERLIRRYADDGGDAVILRPTCVFGPGSVQWTTRLARLLNARRIGDLGVGGDGSCNLAFIGDVVAAIVACLQAHGVSGKAFNISSPTDLTWNEFLIRFAKALGATPVRRISVRRLQLETRLLAPFHRVAGKILRSPATAAITPSLASLWRQDIRIDSSAAAAVLSLRCTSADRMIAAVVSGRQPIQQAARS